MVKRGPGFNKLIWGFGVSIALCFVLAKSLVYQVTDDRSLDGALTKTAQVEFWDTMDKGEDCAVAGRFDDASRLYREAAFMPHGWGADQAGLSCLLEEALHYSPSNADAYLALARVDQNYGSYELAAAEYKKGMALSAVRDFRKEKELLGCCLVAEWFDSLSAEKSKNPSWDKLMAAIRQAWRPPEKNGLWITRVWVWVFSQRGGAKIMELVVPSGSKAQDDSVLEALKETNFADVVPNFGGAYYDCTFVCENGQKKASLFFAHHVRAMPHLPFKHVRYYKRQK